MNFHPQKNKNTLIQKNSEKTNNFFNFSDDIEISKEFKCTEKMKKNKKTNEKANENERIMQRIFPKWKEESYHISERLSFSSDSVSLLKSIIPGFFEEDLKSRIIKAKATELSLQWNEKSMQYLRDIYGTVPETSVGERFLFNTKILTEAISMIKGRNFITESDVKEAIEILMWCNDPEIKEGKKKNNFEKKSKKTLSKLAIIREFMEEFRRIARYNDGFVLESEMKEIAQMIGAIEKFHSFENFLQHLNINSFVLLTGPHTYKEGNPLI